MNTSLMWRITCLLVAFVWAEASTAQTLFRWPVGFSVQNGYEWLENTEMAYGCSGGIVYHPGDDISKQGTSGDGDKGEPLYAVADGEVVFADDSRWASLIIRFSLNGRDYYAVYGHSEIDSGSQEVLDYARQESKRRGKTVTFATFTTPYVGMSVKRGDIVGLLWDHHTENAHLHFEIRSSDHPDPDNGSDFCGFYAGKSVSEMQRINRDPLAFVSTDGFIDGTCKALDPAWWSAFSVGQAIR